MGAWFYLDRRLEQVRKEAGARALRVNYVGRRESGSPAGSFHGDHDGEQARIVAAAFGAAPGAGPASGPIYAWRSRPSSPRRWVR